MVTMVVCLRAPGMTMWRMPIFTWNVFRSYRYGERAGADDPWGFGNSLEWATTCPPPRHNFTELPKIRSERPAFELHYPHVVERSRVESGQQPKNPKKRPVSSAAVSRRRDPSVG